MPSNYRLLVELLKSLSLKHLAPLRVDYVTKDQLIFKNGLALTIYFNFKRLETTIILKNIIVGHREFTINLDLNAPQPKTMDYLHDCLTTILNVAYDYQHKHGLEIIDSLITTSALPTELKVVIHQQIIKHENELILPYTDDDLTTETLDRLDETLTAYETMEPSLTLKHGLTTVENRKLLVIKTTYEHQNPLALV